MSAKQSEIADDLLSKMACLEVHAKEQGLVIDEANLSHLSHEQFQAFQGEISDDVAMELAEEDVAKG